MADHRHRAAGRDLEIDAVQDLAARVVAEAHGFEADPRARHRERHRSGPVLHVAPLVEQPEQPLHVHQRLLELAVDHAEQEQRRRELEQIGVDEHEVADGELARHHARGRAPHHRGDADRHGHGLAEVQHRERLLRHHARVLELAQALVVARRLVRLVVEVLDRLVVEQRVDRALVGARVGLDRGAEIARAPLGHRERPDRVAGQRAERDQREAPVVAPRTAPP